MAHGERMLAHNIVLKMVKGLSNIGHVLMMDNFFFNIGLFKKLLDNKSTQPGPYGLTMLDYLWISKIQNHSKVHHKELLIGRWTIQGKLVYYVERQESNVAYLYSCTTNPSSHCKSLSHSFAVTQCDL